VLLYRKLLQFGVLEGLVRRVQKYPVQLWTSEAAFSRLSQQQPHRQLGKYLDGSQCYDEISCHTGRYSPVLGNQVKFRPRKSWKLKPMFLEIPGK